MIKFTAPNINIKEKSRESLDRKNSNPSTYRLSSPKNNKIKLNKQSIPNNNTPNQNLLNNFILSSKNKISYCNIYKAHPWNNDQNLVISNTNTVNQINNILNSVQSSMINVNTGVNTPLASNQLNNILSAGNKINVTACASNAQTPRIFNGNNNNGDNMKINFNIEAVNNPLNGHLSPRSKIKYTRINEFRENNPKKANSNLTPACSQRFSSTYRNETGGKSQKFSKLALDDNTQSSYPIFVNTLAPSFKNSANYSIEKKVMIKTTKNSTELLNKNPKVIMKSTDYDNENTFSVNPCFIFKSSSGNSSTMNNIIIPNNDKNIPKAKYNKISINVSKKTHYETLRPNSTSNFKRGINICNSQNMSNKQNFSNNSSSNPALLNSNLNQNSALPNNHNLFKTSRNISSLTYSKHRTTNSISNNNGFNKNKIIPKNQTKINNYISLSNKLTSSQASFNELYSFKSLKKTKSIENIPNANFNNMIVSNVTNNIKMNMNMNMNKDVDNNNMEIIVNNNSRNKNYNLYKTSSNPAKNIKEVKNLPTKNCLSHSVEKDNNKSSTVASVERKSYSKSPIPKENFTIKAHDKGSFIQKNEKNNLDNNFNKIINGLNQGITHKIKSKLQDFIKNQENSKKVNTLQKNNLKNIISSKLLSSRNKGLNKDNNQFTTDRKFVENGGNSNLEQIEKILERNQKILKLYTNIKK
jgi:hypothetical protein